MKKKQIVFAVVVSFLSAFLLVCSAAVLRLSRFPELKEFKEREGSRVMTDRNGEILRILPLEDGLRREYLAIDDVPPEVLAVFIRSEDRRFFSHFGIDGFAVLRSVMQNLKADRTVSGASTITMQLASMIKPRPPALAGKIVEGWDAMRLEARLSKKEIVELWINAIPFGKQAEGLASGSRAYFGVPVAKLSKTQAHMLAKVPRHPEKYGPLIDGAQSARAAEAGRYVFEAPHFISRIQRRLNAVRSKVGPVYKPDAITTTLDLELQNRILYDLRRYMEKYKESRISDCAALVLDNRSGEVLSYIGSQDYFSDSPGAKIDAVTIENQPGSCLKPFLYAAALDDSWLPCSLLPDIPMDFGGETVYVPMNFNNTFHGPVRMRIALGSSLNVPAVYLQSRLGSVPFARVLGDAGFSDIALKMERAGLGAALGNFEASLFELTRAFTLFPRGGTPVEPVLTIDGPTKGGAKGEAYRSGSVGPAPRSTPPPKQAVSAYAAYTICSILSDPGARIPGFGSHGVFDLPFPVMFKTGTSNQYQNIWALAATEDYTVGVWMGNMTGKTVIGRTGSSLPAIVAANTLEYLHSAARRGRPGPFPIPEGARPVTICTLSGMEATGLCSSTAVEYVPWDRELEPCSFHVREGESAQVLVNYPEPYGTWAARFGRTGGMAGNAGTAGPMIVYPEDGAVYYYDPSSSPGQQAVRIEISGREGPFTIYVNGELKGELQYPPFVWYFPLKRGLWAVGVSGSFGSDEVRFEVR